MPLVSEAIPIGVCGLGPMAQRAILPLLVRSPHFHLEAISSPSRHQLRELGRLYGVERTFTDWREMLGAKGLKAVVVLDIFRQDILMEAVERGLHCFTASPLAFNSANAIAIRDLADEKEVTVLVANLRRYDRSFERAQRLVQEILNQDDARLITMTDIRSPAETERDDLIPMTDMVPGMHEERMTLTEMAMEAGMGEEEASTSLRIAYRTLLDASDQISVLRGLAGKPKQLLHAQMLPMGNFMVITLGYPGELQAMLTIGRTHRFRPEERLEVHGVLSSLTFHPPDALHDLEDGIISRVQHEMNEELRRSFRVGPAKAVENALDRFAECIREGTAAPTGTHPAVEELQLLENIMNRLRLGVPSV